MEKGLNVLNQQYKEAWVKIHPHECEKLSILLPVIEA